MNLLENMNKYDKQFFQWGEISWLHEPVESPHLRLSVAQVIIYPGCRQEKHFHLGEEQLFFVERGSGCFYLDGRQEKISPSMLIYIKPFSEHEVINTGNDDLVLYAIYVPIRLMQLERQSSLPIDSAINDIIPLEMLSSIEDQLSDLLKMDIFLFEKDNTRLVDGKEENEFCKICLQVNQCSMKQFGMESSSHLLDSICKCNYDLVELRTPISVNENILGYIRSDRFVLAESKNIEKILDDLSKMVHMEYDLLWKKYKEVPYIIKSRTYVIHEHLAIASEFIQEMLQRRIMEKELMEKDNEILSSAIEKLKLKDALKKANHRILNERIFTGDSSGGKDIVYPYELEIILENSILNMDEVTIKDSIDVFRDDKYNGWSIVREMLVVLSRTALRPLKNVELIASIRKNYEKYIHGYTRENPWDILEMFTLDCVGAYNKAIQASGMELIDNINLYIQSHFREDLNLNMVAERFFISPNYLSSLFNDKNGISFSEYIQVLRIEEAKLLLKNTRMKVLDVSSKVGYKNNSYFTSIFKKHVAMTPNEYRKNND